jgi:hypothetical protein
MYVKTLHCIYTPTNPNIGSIYACGGRTRAIAAGSTAVCSERHRLLEIETAGSTAVCSERHRLLEIETAGSTAVCSERHRLLEIETESDGIIFSLLRQQTLSPQR